MTTDDRDAGPRHINERQPGDPAPTTPTAATAAARSAASPAPTTGTPRSSPASDPTRSAPRRPSPSTGRCPATSPRTSSSTPRRSSENPITGYDYRTTADVSYGYSLDALLSDPDRPGSAQPCDDNDQLIDATARQLLLAAGQDADGPTWRSHERLEQHCNLTLLTVVREHDDHTFLAAWTQHADNEPADFDLPASGPDVTQRLDEALRVLGVVPTHPSPRCVLVPAN